jgi:16S rRNA (adenine1518-N6/adenine1519-N6)-dimethyltransferase
MAVKYGQHLLSNRHAAERIVQALSLTAEDKVLEIGPGKGALTSYMLNAGHITVIDIDPEMIEKLRNRFISQKNVSVVQSDILEFDLNALDGVWKVVGNLPYNLTSPILRKLADWNGWQEAHVMVQKEVAERICAKVGTPEYSALTVGISLIAEPTFVFELSETSFSPPPRVKSAVVRLQRRATPLTSDVPATQRVIQAAFQQRRKTLLNSLSHGLGVDKNIVEKWLTDLKIEATLRPERLPVELFVKLADAAKKNAPTG